ncbi:MAG: dTDP-4-dehydrorhamnose 3,5-epimerase [Chitinophagaceae bacterium]|nr:dTDP-4-dehydrorhamnose 3,5-epimerase [Chitinophagaceae bacterium]
MPFQFTDFSGLAVFEPRVFEDSRGYFFESYNEKIFKEAGFDVRWVQDNQSSSAYGVIRGLHYQLPPYAQTKLVRVISGKILDVVVDIRVGSPTYGESYSIVLSEENKKQLLIPEGFAHGFSVLSVNAEVLYKCDNFYNRSSEGGIIYNDPALNIDWQIPAGKEIISEKDLV